MADDDSKKPGSEFDRMSLGSLKRELEAQKQKSAEARDEIKARLESDAAKGKAFPWGTLAGVLGGGVVVFFLVVYALRASFPGVADLALPDWVYTPYDGGPPRERPDTGPPVVVAEPDAGRPHHVGGHGHGSSGSGASSGSSGGMGLEGMGETSDPLEGL